MEPRLATHILVVAGTLTDDEDVVVSGAEEIELYRQTARFTPVAVPGR